MLAESLSEFSRDDAIYAMAMFQSPEQKEATAGVKMMSSRGQEIFSDSRVFASEGETPSSSRSSHRLARLRQGLLGPITLNGVPCWEISFRVL